MNTQINMATNIPNRTTQVVKYRNETVKIQTITIAGIECLRLKDVQGRFPLAKVFYIDDVQQAFVHDEHGNDLEPLRIVAHADKIVDAVGSVEDSNQDTGSRLDRIEGELKHIIHASTEKMMTEMYELHEYTTPRYFFILPAKYSDHVPLNRLHEWFHANYRLYFLCECSNEPKEMHIAPHPGYSIKKPKEFIVKYAPYLTKTLNIVQTLFSAGGLVIPELESASSIIQRVVPSQLTNPKYSKKMKQDFEMVKNLLDKVNKEENQANSTVPSSQTSRETPLQGAELREIQNYLSIVDDKHSLGNLYRNVTNDGHVRWVCLEHYDEIRYNEVLQQYISEFETAGGKFDKNTKEVCVTDRNVTSENVQMMHDTIKKGFNLTRLTFRDCKIAKSDLKKLLDLILNYSSINYLVIHNLICNSSDDKKYSCRYMVAEISHSILKTQFSETNPVENIFMLTQLLEQNKRNRILHFQAQDFLSQVTELGNTVENRKYIIGLIVDQCNDIEILRNLCNLNKTKLQVLKLVHSLCNVETLSRFCQILKKNETFVRLDLMDASGFEDDAFIIDLLHTLKGHGHTEYLSVHIRNMQPSDQKETHLMKSLQEEKFIAHLCISSSVISTKFTQALCYAAEKNRCFTFLEFYNCQVDSADVEKLQSLQDNNMLSKVEFYDRPRWDVLCSETDMTKNKIIPNIPANARWKKNGKRVAKQLKLPHGLFIDNNQTIIVADWWNNRIIQWNKDATNGQVIAGVKGKGNRVDQLNLPVDVLLDNETNSLIIADKGNRRILRWSRSDDTKQGEILIDNVLCTGLAMDDQRYLYVSDYEKHEVRRYGLGDKNGTLVIGGKGQGDGLNQLNEPGFLFVDQQRNVYVSDERNHRVLKWNQNTKEVIIVAGGKGQGDAMTQLANPNGIFVDTFGTLYVADTVNHRVMRWSPGDKQGTVIVGGNGKGAAENQFNSPRGLSFDRYGNLYVVDHENNRVQRFDIELIRL